MQETQSSHKYDEFDEYSWIYVIILLYTAIGYTVGHKKGAILFLGKKLSFVTFANIFYLLIKKLVLTFLAYFSERLYGVLKTAVEVYIWTFRFRKVVLLQI